MTNLSHTASFHSNERITPSNRGIKQLGAASLWDLVKVVTAFTIAHSLTLTLAALHIVDLPDSLVEPVIAASIVAVAVQNIVRPEQARRESRLMLAFLFGLFHGLGFAGGLLEVMHGMSGRTVTLAILGFSLGVEAGNQMVLLPLFACLRTVTWGYDHRWRASAWHVRRWGSIIVAGAGLAYLIDAFAAPGKRRSPDFSRWPTAPTRRVADPPAPIEVGAVTLTVQPVTATSELTVSPPRRWCPRSAPRSTGSSRSTCQKEGSSVPTADVNAAFTRIVAPISGRVERSAFYPGHAGGGSADECAGTVKQLDPICAHIRQTAPETTGPRHQLSAWIIVSSLRPEMCVLACISARSR